MRSRAISPNKKQIKRVSQNNRLARFFVTMPDKSNMNPAKTLIFTPFLPNSRLKYVQYVGVRLCQKSSKIAAFWLQASLAPMFLGKTRRVSALIQAYNTRAQRCIRKNTVARPRFVLFLSGIIKKTFAVLLPRRSFALCCIVSQFFCSLF